MYLCVDVCSTWLLAKSKSVEVCECVYVDVGDWDKGSKGMVFVCGHWEKGFSFSIPE